MANVKAASFYCSRFLAAVERLTAVFPDAMEPLKPYLLNILCGNRSIASQQTVILDVRAPLPLSHSFLNSLTATYILSKADCIGKSRASISDITAAEIA